MSRFVLKQFWFFQIFFIHGRLETPKQTETNRKFYVLVSRNKPKHKQSRSCSGLFWFEPNFIFFVSRTPYIVTPKTLSPPATVGQLIAHRLLILVTHWLYFPLWLILCFSGIPERQNQPHGQGLSKGIICSLP